MAFLAIDGLADSSTRLARGAHCQLMLPLAYLLILWCKEFLCLSIFQWMNFLNSKNIMWKNWLYSGEKFHVLLRTYLKRYL
ncbi:hypothetical protein ASD91_01620 [Pseudomonas sp. Root68]|nr:hypothetical protein ASD91_01620 [Pseudomonas sp. Root68]KRB65203.1 hypothetical protein ASD95_11515 [Pseudomonas sp. Root71]